MKKMLLSLIVFALLAVFLPGATVQGQGVVIRAEGDDLTVHRAGSSVVVNDLYLTLNPASEVLRLVDAANNVSNIRSLAEGGHPVAELIMGFMYSDGTGVTANLTTAFEWFLASAEQGNPRATNAVAVMLLDGQGVRANQQAGMELLRRAATDGNAIAQRNMMLGYMEALWGFSENHNEAYRWGRRAALQGDPVAQNWLGYMYLNGHGVQQNVANAINWLREAADQGHVAAAINLRTLTEAEEPAANAEADDDEAPPQGLINVVRVPNQTNATPPPPSEPAPEEDTSEPEPDPTPPTPPAPQDVTNPAENHPNRQMTAGELESWIEAYDGPNSFELEMLAEVNRLRAAAGLDPLILCPVLSKAARLHSQLMAERDFFSHTDPVYGSMRARVHLFPGGEDFYNLAENLGGSLRNGTVVASTQEPWRAVHSWQGSRPHWGHIFNDTREYVGIGSVTDPNGINRVTYLTGSRTPGNYVAAQQTDADIRRGQQNMRLARPLPD